MVKSNKEAIKELLERGVADIVVRESLTERVNSGKQMRIKLGIDPTSPNLHLGHTVVLRKLKQFQELGHTVIFLIGDFTARIGDPSSKLSARKPLTNKEITKNMKRYMEQVGKVIDLNKVEVRYNSEWHNNMDFAELFQLTSMFTVNQMIERGMFQERMKKKKPLWIHEMLYPILQGYDSVALQSDIELGGTDQTFNVLTARTIQPRYDQEPQDIMTVELIEGMDGKDKMSKSVSNTIDLTDLPADMFGKIMSIPDALIVKYFTLLTDVSLAEIADMKKVMVSGENPRDYKAKLGKEIVTIYYSKDEAKKASSEFDQVFKKKQKPTDIPEYQIKFEGAVQILDVVAESGLASSKSEARRLIEQGAVQFDGMPITDWKKKVRVVAGMVLQVGKRKFVKFTKK